MIILAHDGSIYGDWVANYAMQFATHEDDRKLFIIHVEDGQTSPGIVEARLSALEKSCHEKSINCLLQIINGNDSVYRALRHAIPHDPTTLLVCGTRLKPRRKKFLAGSIAENLLRINQCPVIALRVVQPGLLGCPRDLLYPLSGRFDTDTRAEPVLSRLAPLLKTLHLLRILIVNQLRHPYLFRKQEELIMEFGRTHLEAVEDTLSELVERYSLDTDQRIMIANNWPNEVLVQASRLKSQMILLGVGHANLAQRIFQGAQLEKVLLETSCDVGIFHKP